MKPLPRIECSVGVLNLIAFLAVLIAIVVLAYAGKGSEAVMVGLIGVIGSFRPWNVNQSATGKKDDPVNVTQPEDK